MAPATSLNVGHPAPHRHAANPLALLFALLGGPAAWLAQLFFAFASTSYLCLGPVAAGVPGWLGPSIAVLNIGGIGCAIAALLTALRLFWLTGGEHRQRRTNVVDVGEGRTHFLAVWGTVISAVFIVATLANSLSLFLVPLCT